MIIRYAAWDGSQEPFPLDADELMEAMSDDLMEDGDPWSALQRLLRRGATTLDGRRLAGIEELLKQLRALRQQRLERYQMDDVLKDIQEKLEDVVRTEREGIERRLEEGRRKFQAGEVPEGMQKALERMAAQKQQFLDQMPRDLGGAIRALSDYDFMDPEARRKFQELLQALQQQVMQSYFKGMQQAIQNLTPQDLQRIREMVRDLNRMLREKLQGGEPDFEEFMRKHGQFFPGVDSLDDLVRQLQRQIAQMQSLMDSMGPEMRRQLQQMMDAVLRDDLLRAELAQLAMNLEQILPQRQFRNRYPFHGDEPLTLQEAMKLMEELQEIDRLERQLRNVDSPDQLKGVDVEKLREMLGDEAAQSLQQLQELARVLEEAGYLERKEEGFELTPRAIRRIGQKALRDIFSQLRRDRFGKHQVDHRGRGGERTDDTKQYEFGDPFLVDLEQTLMNALERNGPGTPVAIRPEDFEVYRTEYLTQSSTVLLLDMSRSMILRGCFSAAKKVAVALHTLIRGQFPRDILHVVLFSLYAREVKPEVLPQLTYNEWQYGTNMQHAFMVARQLLARRKGGNKTIILITDGEPTAHFEGGRVDLPPEFSYPPTYRTFEETLKEVKRCTREGIVINTFMLDRTYSLLSFVEQMAHLNRGRAFFATPDKLGEYILVDYVASKRKTVR